MSESWMTYLLLCADGKIYCGVTNDMEKRLDAHNRGIASRFTRARLPLTLLATSRSMGKAEAFRLEYRIKRLPKKKKLAALTSAQRRPRTRQESRPDTIGWGKDCGQIVSLDGSSQANNGVRLKY